MFGCVVRTCVVLCLTVTLTLADCIEEVESSQHVDNDDIRPSSRVRRQASTGPCAGIAGILGGAGLAVVAAAICNGFFTVPYTSSTILISSAQVGSAFQLVTSTSVFVTSSAFYCCNPLSVALPRAATVAVPQVTITIPAVTSVRQTTATIIAATGTSFIPFGRRRSRWFDLSNFDPFSSAINPSLLTARRSYTTVNATKWNEKSGEARQTLQIGRSCSSVTDALASVGAAAAGLVGAAALAGGIVATAFCQADDGDLDTNLVDDLIQDQLPGSEGSRNIPQSLPQLSLQIPVPGISLPPDGCQNHGARGSDGQCYAVLSKGPCGRGQWFTLDSRTLQGRCSPRPCPYNRVFDPRDQFCHDPFEPGRCQGGRRLFYTAFADPVCDCPYGEFPFPGGNGTCFPLFSRGPCGVGESLSLTEQGSLACLPARCPQQTVSQLRFVPFAPFRDGLCYQLGTQGPCGAGELLGYSVSERQPKCVNVTKDPYAVAQRDFDEFSDIPPHMFSPSFPVFVGFSKRQGDSAGVFQTPTQMKLVDPLLNSCRPGARVEENYKCVDPVVFFWDQKLLNPPRGPSQPNIKCSPGEALVGSRCENRATLSANAFCGTGQFSQFDTNTRSCRKQASEFG